MTYENVIGHTMNALIHEDESSTAHNIAQSLERASTLIMSSLRHEIYKMRLHLRVS